MSDIKRVSVAGAADPLFGFGCRVVFGAAGF